MCLNETRYDAEPLICYYILIIFPLFWLLIDTSDGLQTDVLSFCEHDNSENTFKEIFHSFFWPFLDPSVTFCIFTTWRTHTHTHTHTHTRRSVPPGDGGPPPRGLPVRLLPDTQYLKADPSLHRAQGLMGVLGGTISERDRQCGARGERAPIHGRAPERTHNTLTTPVTPAPNEKHN